MSAKTGAVIGSLLFLVAALGVATAKSYQPDDPVPPGSVFRIINLESRIIDLLYRVEAAPDIVPNPRDGKGIGPGIASGPHSTISSDFLYLPANPDAVATLTIRLADRQGQPLQGKRVQVASAVSSGPEDTIIQPQAPTDAGGIATARVKPSTPPHTARFSARVLEDNVDIGQVVEIEVQNPGPPSFFPPAFAPYFDEKKFVVSPTPLKVGQPTTITVPLTNLRKVPVEARVRFFANALNIGLGHWPQIGETETFVLQPGESREAKITWTPTAESHHLCFKAEIWGRELPPRAAAGPRPGWLQFVGPAFAQSPAGPATTGTPALMDSRQQNVGPVQPKNVCPEEHSYEQGRANELLDALAYEKVDRDCDALKYASQLALPGVQEVADDKCPFILDALVGRPGMSPEARHAIFDPMAHTRYNRLCADMEDLVRSVKAVAHDPPDQVFRHLAIATADNPASYIDAARASLERYQGAEAAGDREWMARQFTAKRLYLNHAAEAFRRDADAMQRDAEQLPADEAKRLAEMEKQREEFLVRMRRGEHLTQAEIEGLRKAGFSEEEAKVAIGRLLALKELPKMKTLRTILLEAVGFYRQMAKVLDSVGSAPATIGEPDMPGRSLSETYLVGNPHDREETVDLVIRRVSIPSEWKLSIEDAERRSAKKPQKRVQEVEAGRHYRVQLPAQGQLTVASVVVPVGVIGENITARWAVEGKIGDELIGGMVHVMHVPGVVADLKLPPIMPDVVTRAPVAPAAAAQARWMMPAAIAAAALLVLATVLVLLLRSRRKGVPGP